MLVSDFNNIFLVSGRERPPSNQPISPAPISPKPERVVRYHGRYRCYELPDVRLF